MLSPVIGYAGRVALGLGMALVFAAVGVVLARMSLVLFGLTSWSAWFTLFVSGAGLGAGIGSLLAWMWLKSVGSGFTAILFLVVVVAGVAGGLGGYHYGAGLEPECCASPEMGPIAYTVLGAVAVSNVTALLFGVIGQTVLRGMRRAQSRPGAA